MFLKIKNLIIVFIIQTSSDGEWDIKPTSLFRIYSPDNTGQLDLSGNLLLEIENNGKPARSFRFALSGDNIIGVTTPADKITSYPGCEAFRITIQFRPDEVVLRDNCFSSEWMDVADLVAKGKALPTLEDTDHTDEFLEITERNKTANCEKGGVLRWAINVSPTEELELVLQSLPVSLAAINGRPAFVKDICPGHNVTKMNIITPMTEHGALRGPTPTLFAPDVEAAEAAIRANMHNVKKGKYKGKN